MTSSAPSSAEPIEAAVAYEPCVGFAPDAAEPGICAGCGWLEDEHPTTPHPVTEVPAAA